MKRTLIILAVIAVSSAQTAIAQDDIVPLKLIRALPVEGPENNQPSGLTIRRDTLFAVSDKHDDTIFRIELKEDRAVFVPYLKFEAPGFLPFRLDFEGITCDAEGNFYLVSESAFRILRISANGEQVTWITESLQSAGEKVGLFQTRGAYLEGITLLGNNRFLVCAERQPRGLIEVNTSGTPPEVKAFNYNDTRLSLPDGRKADFTGLFWEDQELFALQRGATAVCKLVYGGEKLEERDAWSYQHIVDSEELRYESMEFGRGEGLCLDRKRVYVILDNNNDPRALYPDDRRPLLLIMERP